MSLGFVGHSLHLNQDNALYPERAIINNPTDPHLELNNNKKNRLEAIYVLDNIILPTPIIFCGKRPSSLL